MFGYYEQSQKSCKLPYSAERLLGIPKNELSISFIYACCNENVDLFYALIEHAVDVSFKWNGVIHLIAAVCSGHIELLGSLIALGDDTNYVVASATLH